MDTRQEGDGEPSKGPDDGAEYVIIPSRAIIISGLKRHARRAVEPWWPGDREIVALPKERKAELWRSMSAPHFAEVVARVEELLSNPDLGGEERVLRKAAEIVADLISRFDFRPKGEPKAPPVSFPLRLSPPPDFSCFDLEQLRRLLSASAALLRRNSPTRRREKQREPYGIKSDATVKEEKVRYWWRWLKRHPIRQDTDVATVLEERLPGIRVIRERFPEVPLLAVPRVAGRGEPVAVAERPAHWAATIVSTIWRPVTLEPALAICQGRGNKSARPKRTDSRSI